MAEPTRDRSVPVACTVVARNYLPAARVLARSYLDHHPGHRFVVAVIDTAVTDTAVVDRTGSGAAGTDDAHTDDAQEPGATGDGPSIVGPEAFGIDEDDYLRMATGYSVTELATAVKPYLLRSLRVEHDVAIYLDPDIQVFAAMPELVDLTMAHQIVLTPHFLEPLPRDGKQPSEAAIMGSGIFNLGFVAVGPGSERFLEFWALRLRHDAIVAPEEQLFTDQRWVDQVPALFTHHVLRDPGFNVAYWNAHERPVTRAQDGSLSAGGKPLRFFHFSGYRPETPWLLTHHAPSKPRVLLSDNPEIRRLCEDYRGRLKAAGYAETLDAIPYGYATLPDGTALGPALRRLFRDAWVEAERAHKPLPPHGFGPDGGAEFRAWLAAPPTDAPARSGLNRLTAALWERRADLRRVFPEPHGRDADAFREWCATSGVAEEKLADWALPTPPPPLTEPSRELGVNVLGYLTAELGVGEMGRILHDTVRAAGVPMVSVVEDRLVVNRTGIDNPDTQGVPRFPISLLCVNADQTQVVLESHPDAGHNRYRIGVWAWELEHFPDTMHPAFGLVDEVWTVSEFCRDAIARRSPVPVKTIPVPVREHAALDLRRVPGEPVRFLFVFDFNSIADRKNPWGLVWAFQRAFDDRDDVRLVIKSINGDKNQHARERLRVMVSEDQRIELIERYLDTNELYELYRRSHCYVSLHRSEGFGLTVAEAMARGMPVIATDYSSTAEFLDQRTGWPVPYRLVEVGKGNQPYPAEAFWAQPDLDAAAEAMRQVAADPEEATRRGTAAREHIRRTRSMDTAAEWIGQQLYAAHHTWSAARGGGEAAPVPEPLRPLRDAREALRWRPEVDSSSRTPLAPAMRRIVLRAIDHYDVHQRTVLGALTDGVENTTARLLARIDELEGRLEALGAGTHAMQRQLDTFRGQHTNTEATLRDLHQDLTMLHGRAEGRDEVIAKAFGDLEDIRARLDEDEKKTFDMFVERDRRSDITEAALRDLRRDVAASHQAALIRHAPVPAGAEVVVCDAGALLVPRDDVFLPWLRYHRTWEEAEARLLAELAGTGLFVDVGAHIGYHTLRLLRDSPTVAGVVAIEANQDTARLLSRNLDVNLPGTVRDAVTVLPVAAWDEDGSVTLGQAAGDNSGDFRVLPEHADGTVVTARRLEAVPEIRDRMVSLIKVDLQGRDHRAVAGLAGILERDRPHVVCEFSPADIEELGDQPAGVLDGYRELGYDLVPVTESGPIDGEHQDLIALARGSATGFVTVWLRPR